MPTDFVVFANSDCSSDHQLLIAKFRLKVKEVGKITRPARYNLNKIPYEYAVKVMKRFKGSGLANSVPQELWTVVVILHRRQ